MRAALYARVSTDEQVERFGLVSQLHELRALAARKGYEVSAGSEYVDDGYSGADLERPALARLRDAVRAGAFDVVLIHDPDRLSRRLAHQLLLTEEIERAGVRLEFQTTPREDSAEGRLLLHVKGVLGEYEREKIKERTLRGKRAKARAGLLPAGPIPFGYRKDPSGRLVIHEDEARVIRLLFRYLLDEQRSLRKITEALTRVGCPAPHGGNWVSSTVKRLAQSEVYAGRMWWNRWAWVGTKRRLRPETEWILIDVPAIVPRHRLEQAREQLTRNRTVFSGRPSPRFYLLRGLLKCGKCGRPWHGVAYHGRRNYRCGSRDRAFYVKSCGSGSRRADVLETLVWDAVVEVLRQPAVLATHLDAYRTRLGVTDVEVRSEAAHIARQLAALDRQEQKLLELFLGDAVDSSAARTKLGEITTRRQTLRDRAGKIRARLVQAEAEAARQDAITRYCRRALRGLKTLTPDGRRQLLVALVDSVVIAEDQVEIHGVLPGRSVAGAKPLRVSA